MKTFATWICCILLALALAACSQESKPEKPAQPAKETAGETSSAEQMAEQAEAKVKETVDAVKQEAEKTVEAAKQKADETIDSMKAASDDAVRSAQEKMKPVIPVETDIKTVAPTGPVDEKQASASDQIKEKMMEPVVPAVPSVNTVAPKTPAAGEVTSGPTAVTYEASMGKVVFNHAEHAGRIDCAKCHPTDPPEKIAINKEVAHNQLCKTCHQESGGAAPTGCTGCHKK